MAKEKNGGAVVMVGEKAIPVGEVQAGFAQLRDRLKRQIDVGGAPRDVVEMHKKAAAVAKLLGAGARPPSWLNEDTKLVQAALATA